MFDQNKYAELFDELALLGFFGCKTRRLLWIPDIIVGLFEQYS